jgi:mannose-1-phosphate guanylyltransferase/mannose-6-phosphate isomerase
VAEFVEKPDTKTAQRYLESGDYLWNSGIFIMRVDLWLVELAKHRPEIEQACRAAFEGSRKDKDNNFYRVDEKAFLSGPSDSIDFAVMEKTNCAAVVPLEAGWSDVGSWSSLWEICPRDDAGNVIQGDVLTHESHNNLLISQSRCLATVGVEDLVVVETPDAVLVADKKKCQDVKEIVRLLKENKREEYKIHRKVYRPWGSYENTDVEKRFQVKRLSVKAGASLSLQMHHHRSEHWIVVEGTARVTVDDKIFTLSENQSTYIPIRAKHRLENPGKIPLEIIEVQSGSYLGEDDIERFEDIYDRC